jgi:hypothetical protein
MVQAKSSLAGGPVGAQRGQGAWQYVGYLATVCG